jgi:hypothetical protein
VPHRGIQRIALIKTAPANARALGEKKKMNITLPKQNCPLCDRVVEFVGIDFGRKKKFNCPHCSVYKISIASEEAITKLSKEQKEIISKAAAQCRPQTMLLIWTDQDTKQIKYDCVPEND